MPIHEEGPRTMIATAIHDNTINEIRKTFSVENDFLRLHIHSIRKRTHM